jgi:endo-1,4-beta-xylanase
MIDRRKFVCAMGSMLAASLWPVPGTVQAAQKNISIRKSGRYDGMESSALWRKEALERIEKLRKANFKITVQDKQGNPIPGAEVRVSQYRHDFGFGAAVKPGYLFESGDAEHQQFYRETTSTYFHRLTIANGLKWKHYDRLKPMVDKCLEWCSLQQLPVRGHCLVWPGFRRIPNSLGYLKTDKAALRTTIEEHVKEFATMYDEPLIEWDVLNEPFTDHEFMDLLGPEVVNDWFRITKEANPRLTRYINDYGVLTRPGEAHQQFYFDYIRQLLAANVAVQGIGFQGHIPEKFEPTPPSELLQTMDRFATLGLPLQVTEFDFETTNQELQAQYTSDFLIAVFSHPAMTGLVTWTPYEYLKGQGSKPDAAFFDHNRREKPNGHVWNSLVNQTWKTEEVIATDEAGHAAFRGFKGLYDVEVAVGSSQLKKQCSLLSEKEHVVVVP